MVKFSHISLNLTLVIKHRGPLQSNVSKLVKSFLAEESQSVTAIAIHCSEFACDECRNE